MTNKNPGSRGPLPRYLPFAGLLLLALVAVGCASAPMRDEVVPELAAAGTFPAPAGENLPPASPLPEGGAFWTLFGDSQLDALVAEALEKNDDLRLAEARVAEAEALLGLARADLLPEIGSRLGASRSDPGVDSPPDMQKPSNRITLQGTVSWELDLWGRLRALRGSAAEQLAASVYDREAARLAVAATVARGWLGHRVTAAQLAAARSTLGSFKEAHDLQQSRFDSGVIDDLQLQQAIAEEASALATVRGLELAYERERHALAVVLGRDPVEIGGESLPEPSGLPVVPVVPAGLPSELLVRRPDVRANEARLMAAAGNVAAARVAFLPSLRLSGNIGSETRTLGDLLASGTTIWTIGADIVQAIFSGGRFRAGIAQVEAQQEQLLATYSRAARTAFREVFDALSAQVKLRQAIEARDTELAARQKALELARLRYEAGYVTYLEVLDSQRNLFATEQVELGLKRDALANAVDLMLALGGGWSEVEE